MQRCHGPKSISLVFDGEEHLNSTRVVVVVIRVHMLLSTPPARQLLMCFVPTVAATFPVILVQRE